MRYCYHSYKKLFVNFALLVIATASMQVFSNQKNSNNQEYLGKNRPLSHKHQEEAISRVKEPAAIYTSKSAPQLKAKQAFKEVSLDDVSSGTLLFQQAGSQHYLQAPQLKTTVNMDIKGIVANVNIKQRFTNTSDEWQHALYVFPLPDNAAVNQLKITVAERVIVGEIQEKNKAKKIFNDAKSKGKKAALVEQYRPNLFSTKVANIPPHESIEVNLTYFQQVDFQDGEFSIHFPMAITPRYMPNNVPYGSTNSLPSLIFQARNSRDLPADLPRQKAGLLEDSKIDASQRTYHRFINDQEHLIDLTVKLSAGAELASFDSISHALVANSFIQKTNKIEGDYHLSLLEQPMDKEFKLSWKYQQTPMPQVLNFQQTYLGSHYGLLMVLPGLTQEQESSSRELTFVLDTSGSMAGQSLAQAKQAFKYALNSLTDKDSFQLISFNSYPTKLFSSPVSASNSNKHNAWQYVNALRSSGGTEIMSALKLALEENTDANEKLEQVVFLTDGAVGNEAEIFSYIADNIKTKRLFTVGLGTAPNRYFMKKSAEIGRGSYQLISSSNELVKEMKRLFNKLSNPQLTDLTLILNDSKSELLTAPTPIPDIYQGEPLFLSYQVIGTKTGSLLTGLYKGALWSLDIECFNEASLDKEGLSSIKPDFEQAVPSLATLWARRKIADYFRDLMLYKKPEFKASIIALALKYNLVTAFTSLVAVEQKHSSPNAHLASAKPFKNNIPAGQVLPATSLNLQWRLYIGLALLFLSVSVMCLVLWGERRYTPKGIRNRKMRVNSDEA